MYSGITVKTYVKTVKLNYSGLLYHVQLFAIHSTMQKCKWYNNPLYVFQVSSYFTALGAAIKCKKYSGITVNLITVVYCTLYTCFHVSHICSVSRSLHNEVNIILEEPCLFDLGFSLSGHLAFF